MKCKNHNDWREPAVIDWFANVADFVLEVMLPAIHYNHSPTLSQSQWHWNK
jgi:hypothetical protein